ncbi:hypothetical protein PCANC_17670 [Puccinia coronata f. sp. avenae]|uniref:Uncharacterized protein n=1 Tax=Puccinia coronata f. sp. avenae TaxID=200324 RepID=A0A2N5U9C3_9BASI|nr:hypothetical protein PCANC_17670 [Puccinia coronata f. sp. avenae]
MKPAADKLKAALDAEPMTSASAIVGEGGGTPAPGSTAHELNSPCSTSFSR